MNRMVTALIIGFVLLIIHDVWITNQYGSLVGEYNHFREIYINFTQKYEQISSSYNKLMKDIYNQAQVNCTSVTIMYHTDNSKELRTITLSISYKDYESYHKKEHPYWGEQNLISVKQYITTNDTIITKIVQTVKNQTKSDEEEANALLNFVQYKGITLSLRYYPTIELKYPIETLVEMGGDCDTHSILYATLMKAAGFKVLILLSKKPVSEGLPHVAVAIHLVKSPEHSLPEFDDKIFIYNGEEYYFAETTTWNYRIGDTPTFLRDVEFYMIPI